MTQQPDLTVRAVVAIANLQPVAAPVTSTCLTQRLRLVMHLADHGGRQPLYL